MSDKKIPCNVALLDSLSLKIPMSECQVIDTRLTSMTCIYYESLDAIDEELHPPKPIMISKNGIAVRIGLANIPIYDAETKEHVPTQFINLTVSSKMLREYYFEGINKNNIKAIYEGFIQFNIFKCSYDSFLSAHMSDVDVCINRYSNSVDHFSDALDVLVSQAQSKSKFIRKIQEPSNIGLSFNQRSFAKPSLPFVKLYHKQLELESKSAEFYNTYLFENYAKSIQGLTRIEATIRNYPHKQRLERFGIISQFKTLKEFFDIPQKSLFNFVVFSVNSYIETKARQRAPNLTPMEHMLFESMQNMVLSGLDYKTIEQSLIDGFKGSTVKSGEVARCRMRKVVERLFDLLIHKDVKLFEKAQHNSHVLEYLKFLNLQ